MMETWQILLIIGLCSSPIVLLLVGTTMTYLLNKSEITIDHERRKQEEIMNAAMSYDSSYEFNKAVMSNSIKPILGYGLYFLISIPLLVRIFGSIQYGPNVPYTIFLVAVGIPFLICLCHVLMKVENKRNRMKTSIFNGRPIRKSIMDWIVIVPALYVVLIIVVLKVSNAIIAN